MPHTEEFRARWPDMDFMQHMRNAAYLGCAEDTRMRYLDASGWSMSQFQERRLGPVVVEDKLTYKKELRLLERFSCSLWLAAATPDARRVRLRNTFAREDGAPCAVVDSVILWFDIAARKPVVPPDALRDVMLKLDHTDDFEVWT